MSRLEFIKKFFYKKYMSTQLLFYWYRYKQLLSFRQNITRWLNFTAFLTYIIIISNHRKKNFFFIHHQGRKWSKQGRTCTEMWILISLTMLNVWLYCSGKNRPRNFDVHIPVLGEIIFEIEILKGKKHYGSVTSILKQ